MYYICIYGSIFIFNTQYLRSFNDNFRIDICRERNYSYLVTNNAYTYFGRYRISVLFYSSPVKYFFFYKILTLSLFILLIFGTLFSVSDNLITPQMASKWYYFHIVGGFLLICYCVRNLGEFKTENSDINIYIFVIISGCLIQSIYGLLQYCEIIRIRSETSPPMFRRSGATTLVPCQIFILLAHSCSAQSYGLYTCKPTCQRTGISRVACPNHLQFSKIY